MPLIEAKAALPACSCQHTALRPLQDAAYNVAPTQSHPIVRLDETPPVIVLETPSPPRKKALARAGLTIDDTDLCEVNEAYTPVPLAWLKAPIWPHGDQENRGTVAQGD